jgi:hypothetical protein
MYKNRQDRRKSNRLHKINFGIIYRKNVVSIAPGSCFPVHTIKLSFLQPGYIYHEFFYVLLQFKPAGMKIHFLLFLPWMFVVTLVQDAIGADPVDMRATRETRSLLTSLHEISAKGIMFGHQDALAYGVNWKKEKGRSDVKSVTGDYPAVVGWVIGHQELGRLQNLDSVNFKDIPSLYSK